MFKGTSLVVQWLRLRASTAGGTGSIPGQGTRILHATCLGHKKKKKKDKKVFNNGNVLIEILILVFTKPKNCLSLSGIIV